MTRFARAKGSKASNERVPEPATSWSTMKEHLLEKQLESENITKRKEFEAKRQASYDEFLKETLKTELKSEWAEFPESSDKLKSKKSQEGVSKKSKKKRLKNIIDNTKSVNESEKKTDKVKKVEICLDNMICHDVQNKKAVNKCKAEKRVKSDSVSTNSKDFANEKCVKVTDGMDKTSKKKTKTHKVAQASENKNTSSCSTENGSFVAQKVLQTEKLSKKNKIKKKTSKINENNNNNNELRECKLVNKITNNEFCPKNNSPNQNKKRKLKNSTKLEHNDEIENQENDKKRKNKKRNFKDCKNEMNKEDNDNVQAKRIKTIEFKRRKPDNEKMFVSLGDKDEEVVRFDGFPIKISDAERLNNLRKQMISKGIPKNEVNRTLKLERRKAEKALARDRRKTCFHCRKAGHVLSECPELGSKSIGIDTSGTGICYKCGSTEHTHFECKSVRGQEFKFAECFICKEQGHIARQCPDNPKGLYPQGGGCRLCGDVTHLKKDCPQNLQSKEENNFTLKTLSAGADIESLDDETSKSVTRKINNKRIVKF